jgi:hypothetical protein
MKARRFLILISLVNETQLFAQNSQGVYWCIKVRYMTSIAITNKLLSLRHIWPISALRIFGKQLSFIYEGNIESRIDVNLSKRHLGFWDRNKSSIYSLLHAFDHFPGHENIWKNSSPIFLPSFHLNNKTLTWVLSISSLRDF